MPQPERTPDLTTDPGVLYIEAKLSRAIAIQAEREAPESIRALELRHQADDDWERAELGIAAGGQHILDVAEAVELVLYEQEQDATLRTLNHPDYETYNRCMEQHAAFTYRTIEGAT